MGPDIFAAPSLLSSYQHALTLVTDDADLGKLSPNSSSHHEADTSISTASESVTTPDSRGARVFTYVEGVDGTADRLGHLSINEDDKEEDHVIAMVSPSERSNSILSSSSSTTSPTKGMRRPASASSTNAFRARPVPKSIAQPSITPKLSRAAALRLGIDLPARTPSRDHTSQQQKVVATVSTDNKRPITPPKSLRQPAITPRATKSSSLRTNPQTDEGRAILTPSTIRRQTVNTSERSAGYEGTPGYGGRRISVASTSTGPVSLSVVCRHRLGRARRHPQANAAKSVRAEFLGV